MVRSVCSPFSLSAPFYGYLRLLKLHRMERSRSKDVWSGNRTWDLLHKGRALTDCAILAPQSSLNSSKFTLNKNKKFSYITFNNSFKWITFYHICFTTMHGKALWSTKNVNCWKIGLIVACYSLIMVCYTVTFVLNFQSPTHVRWIMVIAAIFVC